MKKEILIGASIWLCMYGTAWPQEKSDAQIQTSVQGTISDPLVVQSGSKPTPDPTALTAEAIRELRRELTTYYATRFDDIVKQIDRLREGLDEQPSNIRTEIANLNNLVNEKFKGLVDQQIQRDNNLALALTAAQKSVTDTNLSNITAANKAEQSFKDQIAATQSTITDLKDRITRIESGSAGSGSAINWVIAAIGVFATLIAIGSALYAMTKTPAPLPVVNFAPEPLNTRRRS